MGFNKSLSSQPAAGTARALEECCGPHQVPRHQRHRNKHRAESGVARRCKLSCISALHFHFAVPSRNVPNPAKKPMAERSAGNRTPGHKEEVQNVHFPCLHRDGIFSESCHMTQLSGHLARPSQSILANLIATYLAMLKHPTS